MSNPNTVTVYSPDGEPFEMSSINARDLCRHRNWSMSPPDGAQPAPTEIKEPADAVPDTERGVEDVSEEGQIEGSEAGQADAGQADEAEADEEVTEEADEAPKDTAIFTTEEQFADLPERADVVAYLAATFPDFKPHHKSSRDGLVAKAIELATA